MNNILWQPQEGPQTDFCKSDIFEVLFGGAAGGGKSDALLVEGLRQIHIPGYRAILFRREGPQLKRLIDRSIEIFPGIGGEWKDSKSTWHFPNNVKYIFSHMEHEKDKLKHDGQEYQYIGFDELTHFTETQYKYLYSRCRTSSPDLTCYIRASAMPMGVGISWVKQRFIDYGPHEVVIDTDTGLERQYIPSRLDDNKVLMQNDPQYEARLKLMGPKLYKALRLGDWDSVEGAAFEELDKRMAPVGHMMPAHEPPPGSLIWRAFDWGYAKPFSCGWYYEDCDGNIIRFREWYGWNGNADKGLRMGAREVARGIKEIDNFYDLSHGIADASIFSKQDNTPSIAEEMEAEEVYWYPSDSSPGSRIQGKMQIHGRLQAKKVFVTENCKHFWRTIPVIQVDERKPEDVDTKMEDHLYDEFRYGLMDRPMDSGIMEIDLGEDRESCLME